MYLSRLTLDARHRDTREWLADCHKLHRTIMTAFGPVESEAARAELGVLFRAELPADGAVPVLVQSKAEPRWGIESRAVLSVEGPGTLDALESSFVNGGVFRFRLRANPTRRIHRRASEGADLRELDTSGRWKESSEIPEFERTGLIRRREADHGRPGQRVELNREEDRMAWLARRGREHDGFELLTIRAGGQSSPREVFDARADPAGRVQGRASHQGGDRRLTFATALFEGELRITQVTAFRQAFQAGIGPGKAFGCGLLSLMPISHM